MSDDIKPNVSSPDDRDPTARSRKRDHIELAFESQVAGADLDARFFYEPLLSGHPEEGSFPETPFLGSTLRLPVWVSSMTGGTEWAHTINHNLARACSEFGMGMGLGSCRSLLYSDDTLKDFSVRSLMGDQPLFANLGIAQVEELFADGAQFRIGELVRKLEADGLIIHVNPLQEWLQPEGDRFKAAPIDTIRSVIDHFPDIKLIVKEVGQGMGRSSLEALLSLPLEAVDFAANGGTNFARLELLRSDAAKQVIYKELALVGHSALEMVGMVNQLVAEKGDDLACRQIIISGGVKTFLDGYYLIHSSRLTAIYGQASAFLKHARGDYEELAEYVRAQREGLELANAFLRPRSL